MLSLYRKCFTSEVKLIGGIRVSKKSDGDRFVFVTVVFLVLFKPHNGYIMISSN